MATKNIQVEQDERGSYYFIKVNEYFSSINVVDVRKAFEFALEIGHNQIALDLSEVVYMDSMSMGLILNINDRLKKQEGKLVVVNPNTVAEDILNLSDASRFLEIHHNVENVDIVFD